MNKKAEDVLLNVLFRNEAYGDAVGSSEEQDRKESYIDALKESANEFGLDIDYILENLELDEE
ncbi:hypothetical protein [Listeria booriae]|uniref:hypothetical protein n=1 Tax=Listeria booriae TaxID=1552123 RepID=UPI001628162F|nr:hypothetical protein [Listeria booriae]MBC2207400.1 hypothetical protein [Listeria booriae]